MDGLIDQAKAQLWKVVNELARARRNGRHPQLEVALFEYGNNGLRESEGWLRMVSDLTTDLDLISEKLFGLTTNGGDEYCGEVIGRAVDRLSWSGSDDVLKVIYIAGNEPFDQGRVSYKASAAPGGAEGDRRQHDLLRQLRRRRRHLLEGRGDPRRGPVHEHRPGRGRRGGRHAVRHRTSSVSARS